MAPPTSQSKPPPLPLAADRAAITNRISLLIANRSSVLKTMSPSVAAAATTTPSRASRTSAAAAAAAVLEDQEDLWRNASRLSGNEGVGYTAAKKDSAQDAEASRRDQILRSKLLGKRKASGRSTDARGAIGEDEEDDDEGRSALGKRKRPKKNKPAQEEGEEREEMTGVEYSGPLPREEQETTKDEQGEDGVVAILPVAPAPEPEPTAPDAAIGAGSEEQKKKKRKKKKRKDRRP